MTVVSGVVESSRKDRTGVKVLGQWYQGEGILSFNKGDEVKLKVDAEQVNEMGNPLILDARLVKAAANPFKGGNKGTSFKGKSYDDSPDKQARIARSTGIKAAIDLIAAGKKDLKELYSFSEEVCHYIVNGVSASGKETASAPPPTTTAKKPPKKAAPVEEDDLDWEV